jgi:predicted Holliday junction resolvase-like endonuclease
MIEFCFSFMEHDRKYTNIDEALDIIWLTLTSDMAIYVYLIAILLLMIVVIILMMTNEVKRQRLATEKATEMSETAQEDHQSLEEDKENISRFFMLNQVDQNMLNQHEHAFKDDIDLLGICEEFRHFSAYNLGLYYDIQDIRRFIGGLSVSHMMILQGMSGTGKTSLAYAFGDYLKNTTVVVPIQPMWKERTDMIGYYNEFTKKFNETTLLQKLYEASLNDRMYVTVLDEMNIARVEYYFAEFLSLLELPDQNKRHLDVISDVWETDPALLNNGKLILPNNMWFVGTANNDDSTFSISDKVYDRSMVINLDYRAKPFIPRDVAGRSISATRFEQLTMKARKEYELSNRNLRRIKQLDEYLMKHFQITFGNRIMMQIYKYVPVIVACGGTELSALDDMMSKKVLRKLEAKNMVYVKNAAPGLVAFIEELFGNNEMAQCIEYIRKIEINA